MQNVNVVLAIANPSVRHTLELCQHDSCYDQRVLAAGYPHDPSFLVVNFSTNSRGT